MSAVQGFPVGGDASFGQRIRAQLLHNHSTTNLNIVGLRPPGECTACDHARDGWQHAVEQGR